MRRPQFKIAKGLSSEIVDVRASDVCYVGDVIDERGKVAVDLLKSRSQKICSSAYDPVEMMFQLEGKSFEADSLAAELTLPRSSDNAVVLEASTLGFPEIFLIVEAALRKGHGKFIFTYVEPSRYEASKGEWSEFDLSEEILGFRPIPRAIINLASSDVSRGLFFVGYEPGRLDRAFEDHQMITASSATVVFGLPAFSPGWELNAIVPHLEVVQARGLRDLQFCPADNPSAAYDLVFDTMEALTSEERMFVAPIGPKPFGIGAAIAAALFPSRVGIIYDHPRRKKGRSNGVGSWHCYAVDVESDGIS